MPVILSKEDKIEIVLIVGDNYKTFREAATIFNQRHPDKNIHHETVRQLLKKFKTFGNVENKFNNKRQKHVADNEMELEVMLSAIEQPRCSLRKRALLMSNTISKDSVAKILKTNKFHPYKPKFVHTLRPGDNDRRLEFCADIQAILEDNPFVSRQILFSDEATFTTNGTVSSQNCRWWADANPNFTLKTRSQYAFKTNVWCGIYKSYVIGPFFFHQSLNADRYLNFLQSEISNLIDNLPLLERQHIWFQQDGAPCHSRLDVRQYVEDCFNERVIHRFSEIRWPPRSPDLTPLDFFLWGYLKENVYIQAPFTDVGHLERVIREEIRKITPQTIRRVLRHFCDRTVTCMEREGGYVEAFV